MDAKRLLVCCSGTLLKACLKFKMNLNEIHSTPVMYSEPAEEKGTGSPPQIHPTPNGGSLMRPRDAKSVLRLPDDALKLEEEEKPWCDDADLHWSVNGHRTGCRCETCWVIRMGEPPMPEVFIELHGVMRNVWVGTFSEVNNLINQLKTDGVHFEESFVSFGASHCPKFIYHVKSRDVVGSGSSTSKKGAKSMAYVSLIREWSYKNYCKINTMWGLNGHNGTVNGIDNHRMLTRFSEFLIWMYAIFRFGPSIALVLMKWWLSILLTAFGMAYAGFGFAISVCDFIAVLYVGDVIIPSILSLFINIREPPTRINLEQMFRRQKFYDATYHLWWYAVGIFIRDTNPNRPSAWTCVKWLLSYYNTVLFGTRFGGRVNRLSGLEPLIEGQGGRWVSFLLYFNVYVTELILLVIDMVKLMYVAPMGQVWDAFVRSLRTIFSTNVTEECVTRYHALRVWISYYMDYNHVAQRPWYFWFVFMFFGWSSAHLHHSPDVIDNKLWMINRGVLGAWVVSVMVLTLLCFFIPAFWPMWPYAMLVSTLRCLYILFIWYPAQFFSSNAFLVWITGWLLDPPFNYPVFIIWSYLQNTYLAFYAMSNSTLWERNVVEVETDETAIRQKYRKSMLRVHPDKPGGSHEAFIELQEMMQAEINDSIQHAYVPPSIFPSTDEYLSRPVETEEERQDREYQEVIDRLNRIHEEMPGFGEYKYERCRGGGRGKKMVSSKVKSKGTGGKSKQRKPPQAPLAQDSDGSVEGDGEPGEAPRPFVYSAFPNVRSLHTGDEMIDMLNGPYSSYDCMGAPYCGYTCIDIACGIEPDLKLYRKWVPDADPFDGGTFERLGEFSKFRGVNLSVMFNGMVIWRHNHLQSHKWVVLNFTCLMDHAGEPEMADGHYELIVANVAASPNLELPVPNYSNFSWWNLLCYQVVNVAYYVNSNNDDKRPVRDQRERIVHQDRYAKVTMMLKTPWVSLNDTIAYQYGQFLNTLSALDRQTLEYWVTKFLTFEYHVSVMRVLQSYSEMQFLTENQYEKAWLNMGRIREVNTRSDLVNLHLDGVGYLKHLGWWMVPGTSHFNTIGLKVYNAPNADAFINNIQHILANQARGAGQDRAPVNHVKSFDLSTGCKHSKVVATSPIGCIRTADGPVCPGPIPLTDAYGVLAAFAGRSMIKDQDELDFVEIRDFVTFSKKFWQPFIDSTDVSGIFDEEPEVYFREHFKGRKSKSWINQQLEQYRLYKLGLHESKFTRNSCFVKFENSSKIVNGRLRTRPRLIMTLKPSTAVEVCQVHKVIERFNHTNYSDFIVKGLDAGGVSNMVELLTDKAHVITDMTAFESSLNSSIREVENYIIQSLLKKAGLDVSLDAFDGIEAMRVLGTKFGVLKLNTRCSGDPWTAFSNGTSNVSLNAYCAYRKGHDMSLFNMIAEGDDGIVSPDVPDVGIMSSLGFKFSSELVGTQPGDVDFLRCRFVAGHKLLNVGRALTNFWVKTQTTLGTRKQMAILRCMGYSLYYQSPGHPILTAIVNKIGKKTASYTKAFKSFMLFSDGKEFPTSYPRNVSVDPLLRMLVAEGACGFPPISVAAQLSIEDSIERCDDMYIGHLLDDYDDVKQYVLSGKYLNPVLPTLSAEMRELIVGLECVTGCEYL